MKGRSFGSKLAALAASDPHPHRRIEMDLIVFLLLATFVGLSSSSAVVRKDGDGVGDCVYTLHIETGCNRDAGGADSVISVALSSEAGGNGGDAVVQIANLEQWGGLMGANHRYFGRNNLDVFSGRGPCLPGPPCRMELSSSGGGGRWYCNYVQVTATGPHINCTQQLFTVEQWLARDRVPYQLSATRDYCGGGSGAGGATTKVEQMVGAGDN